MYESSLCWFETFDDFYVESADGADFSVYYFPYKGYGPEMWLKNSNHACVFECQKEYQTGQSGVWYPVNDYGGTCGYMVYIAVEENDDYDHNDKITIKKLYRGGNNEQSAYYGTCFRFVSLLSLVLSMVMF